MINTNQLQKIKFNNTALEEINSAYLQDINELSSFLPKKEREKLENSTQEVKDSIVKAGRKMTSGIRSSIPMICKGDKCCLVNNCELFKNDIAPLGYLCAYEEFMVDKLTSEYYMTLNVDPFNRVERDLIKQMVELIIIDNRTSADISNDGLYMEQNIGVDNKGRPITSKMESLAYSIKIKTQQRIEKLQNELMATRKVKKQYGSKVNDDPSSRASSLFEKFKEANEKNKVEANVEIINDKPKDDIIS